MKFELPPSFEKTLLSYLKETYLKNRNAIPQWGLRDAKYFSKGIIELNDSFTQARSERRANYFNDPVMRSGYLAYFLPVNAVKVLQILMQRDEFMKSQITMADVGAGPLTMSFGFLFFVLAKLKPGEKIKIVIDAYEQNKKILVDGQNLMQNFLKHHPAIDVRVNHCVGDLNRMNLPQRDYDYVLVGNLLNEYEKREDQWQVTRKMLARFFGKQGKLVMLEPASKKISRDLQQLRDVILKNTDFVVIAPCLHQETCPLNLTAKSDWCNFQQQWVAPQFIRDFDELTELKKTCLMYSYLFMTKGIAQKNVPDKTQFVAISDLMHAKGRYEIIGCGPAGRVRFIRAHRDQSEENHDFDQLWRGMQFTMPDYVTENSFQLNVNVPVKKKDRVKC